MEDNEIQIKNDDKLDPTATTPHGSGGDGDLKEEFNDDLP